MQKKLIALAIAGLSGAAFAQSNVTIYGVMDATYDNLSATGATTANVNLPNRGRTTFNSSYVGFKGTEALGNGLAVAFQVESGIGESSAGSFGGNAGVVNTTAGNVWATRDTYVGLAGGFGTIAFGNLTGPTRALGAALDVNAGATGIGANTALLGKMGGGSGAGLFDQRISNAIAYISPNMSGFSGVLGYLPNENRGTDATNTAAVAQRNGEAWTLGLNYANGPVYVGFAYTDVKDKNANSTSSGLVFNNNSIALASAGGLGLSKVTSTRLGGKYDFGMGTIGLLWDQTKATAVTAVNGVGVQAAFATDAKQTVWYLPITFNVGAGKILFQYGHANKATDSGNALANADTSAKHVELGYEYSMSKRTALKAVYSRITNSSQASYDYLYGISNGNSTAYAGGVAAGADPSGISIGLRHSF